jgi:hypothetical protein
MFKLLVCDVVDNVSLISLCYQAWLYVAENGIECILYLL